MALAFDVHRSLCTNLDGTSTLVRKDATDSHYKLRCHWIRPHRPCGNKRIMVLLSRTRLRAVSDLFNRSNGLSIPLGGLGLFGQEMATICNSISSPCSLLEQIALHEFDEQA